MIRNDVVRQTDAELITNGNQIETTPEEKVSCSHRLNWLASVDCIIWFKATIAYAR